MNQGQDRSGAWGKLESMLDGLVAALPGVAIALVVFLLFYLVAKGVRALVGRVNERYRRHQNVGRVLGRLAQGAIVLIGLLVALVIALPSFEPGQLVSLLGIGSVAIGFAFRDILQNFLAGILLLLTEPFRIGDQIIVDDFEGTVEDIQTRATMIRTYDGRRVVIPNSDLFTDSVIVNTAFEMRRLEYDIGIGYGDDIARAKELILGAITDLDGVLPDPAPEVLVVKLADFSVNLRVRWSTRPPRKADVLDVQDRVLTALKNTLLENGIDLPFPTQQILFHDQTEGTDGDRAHQREGWPAGQGAVPEPQRISAALSGLAPARAASRDGNGRSARSSSQHSAQERS